MGKDFKNGKGKNRGGGKKVQGNWGKRQKEDMAAASGEGTGERSTASIDLVALKESEDWKRRREVVRSSRRKYSLCFGYLGTNYHGLQANPGCKTLESELERALFLAGGICESNFGNLHKLQWSRAARTDKGVHANGQCCAMRLGFPVTGNEEIIEYTSNKYTNR